MQLKKFFVMVCFAMFFWFFIFVSAILANDLIDCYSFRGDNSTQSFAVLQEGTTEVTFEPWKTGSWWFRAYHVSFFAPWSHVGVFTYWKDVATDNTWHYWPGGGLACLFFFSPTNKTLLYSGKKSISYKFVFTNYNDFPIPVQINITRK